MCSDNIKSKVFKNWCRVSSFVCGTFLFIASVFWKHTDKQNNLQPDCKTNKYHDKPLLNKYNVYSTFLIYRDFYDDWFSLSKFNDDFGVIPTHREYWEYIVCPWPSAVSRWPQGVPRSAFLFLVHLFEMSTQELVYASGSSFFGNMMLPKMRP